MINHHAACDSSVCVERGVAKLSAWLAQEDVCNDNNAQPAQPDREPRPFATVRRAHPPVPPVQQEDPILGTNDGSNGDDGDEAAMAATRTQAAADMVFTDRRVDVDFFARLQPHQVVNRIPYLDHATLKGPLARAMQAYDEARAAGASAASPPAAEEEAAVPELFPWGADPEGATAVHPQTFFLPDDLPLLRGILAAQEQQQQQEATTTTTTTTTATAGSEAAQDAAVVTVAAESAVAPQQSPLFYIVKPNNGNQGEGIRIVPGLRGVLDRYEASRQEATKFDGTFVVQPYLANPALYRGVKFDLRVYVVVVGDGCCGGQAAAGEEKKKEEEGQQQQQQQQAPCCEAYMLRRGFARLCATPYQPVTANNANVATMHIANDGVNYDPVTAPTSSILRTTEQVFTELQRQDPAVYSVDALWAQLARVAGKTVAALQHHVRQRHAEHPVPFASTTAEAAGRQHRQTYQLLGLDVMVDATGRMWLLECNAKPCMDWEAEEADALVGATIVETNATVMAVALGLGLTAGGAYSEDPATRAAAAAVRGNARLAAETVKLEVS